VATVEREFLSVAETAQLLGCSEKVVRAELKRGRLPAYRVGRLIRVRVADIERLRAPTN
jgi:excisionase family DNA binding protein